MYFVRMQEREEKKQEVHSNVRTMQQLMAEERLLNFCEGCKILK